MASIILLLAGIAAMLWLHGRDKHEEEAAPPAADPLLGARATPSMKATRKYFFVVVGLMLLQIAMGVVTAHYSVEGQSFFGLPLAQVLPYTISRTVHTQIGIFWIATAWLATGLYVAPLLSGREPKLQKLGVDALFWALIVVVLGSTITGWLGTLQHRGVDFSFWLGNQGLEFTSMGRVWQLLLFVGLLFWVFLLGRALWPALKKPSETRGLIAMVFLSATCIGGFYADLADLGPAHALLDDRVLALVAGAPVGRRLLRSVRHRGRRADLHQPGPGACRVGQPRDRRRDHRLPVRRHPRHAAPPVLDRHARPRSSPSARCSRRSKWCR
jgi:nitric oxide reductase large subunit